MTLVRRGYFILILALVFWTGALGAQTYLPSLSLENQFGTVLDLGSLARTDRVLTLYTGERDWEGVLLPWKEALETRMPQGTRVILVVNLKAVPFFVPRGAIKNQLSKYYPSIFVHLDWKGEFAQVIPLRRDKVVVTSWRAGRQEAEYRGTVSPSEAQRLASSLL